MLVAGRGVSLLLNMAAQVLAVRFLAKQDYGAFAYALSMVALLATVNAFGFDKALARFAAIYDERRDAPRLMGAVALSFGTIMAVGTVVVALTLSLRPFLGSWIRTDAHTVQLFALLVVLAPVNAVDALMLALFGVFSGARHVFMRRHVVRPAFRLLAVVVVIALGGGSVMLSLAHVLAGLVGVILFGIILVRVILGTESYRTWSPRRLRVPAREVLGFSLPLLSSDLVFILRSAVVVFLLEFFHEATQVAEFQAVHPLARLNEIVLLNFSVLYVPLLSRWFARGDRVGIRDAYARTTAWVAMLSFPLFALSFGLADPLAVWLFGNRYAASGEFLAWLALGYYAKAVFGLAPRTLRAMGRIGMIVAIDAVTAVGAAVLGWKLIAAYGALGAAVTVAATLVAHGVLNQLGLLLCEDMSPWRGAHARVHLALGGGVLVLAALRWWWGGPPVATGVAAGLMSAGFGVAFRRRFDLFATFPELRGLSPGRLLRRRRP